jgi:hypothetical protein
VKAVTPQHEHEFEPQYGLPERLPAGETLLWQGAPDWTLLARRAFHTHKLALYFGVILILRASALLTEGASAAETLHAVIVLLPLFAIGLGLAALLGWLAARTCVYSLTDKRIVMRIGIVLSVTYNLPLRCIQSADLRPLNGRHGDIALALVPGTRIAYLQLWPHARPWRLARTQPMLRCLPDAERVASLLARTWAQANGTTVHAPATVWPDTRPSSAGHSPVLAGH